MNYELAKELKDAGFPQKEWYGTISRMVDGKPEGERCKVPSLHELIESCGEKFIGLIKRGNKWDSPISWADPIPRSESQCRWGSPAEAVARVWLALNKNDKDK